VHGRQGVPRTAYAVHSGALANMRFKKINEEVTEAKHKPSGTTYRTD